VVLVTEDRAQFGEELVGKEYEYQAVMLRPGRVELMHIERGVTFRVATAPFAQGGLRQAFWAM
jgi:hypothetical protein